MENTISETRERPTIITIFCIVAFIAFALSLLSLPTMLGAFSEAYGAWYVPTWLASLVLTCISIIGYWQMRKWGVYLYTTVFVLGIGVGLISGLPFTIVGTVVPMLIIAIGFYYQKRMH